MEEGLPGYEKYVIEGQTLQNQTQLDEPTCILRFLANQYGPELYNIGKDAENLYWIDSMVDIGDSIIMKMETAFIGKEDQFDNRVFLE